MKHINLLLQIGSYYQSRQNKTSLNIACMQASVGWPFGITDPYRVFDYVELIVFD